jgi:hypothetical protein
MRYVKIVRGVLVFYIHVDVISLWIKERADGSRSDSTTTRYAELVVNLSTDEILKSRHPLNEVIHGRFSRPFMTITLEE